MKFTCKASDGFGKSEDVTLNTLLQWSGKTEADIHKLMLKAGDTNQFEIDGYTFKYLSKKQEERKKRDRKRYLEKGKDKPDYPVDFIEDGVEWAKGERPTRVRYEVDGVVTARAKVVKMLKTSSDRLMFVMRDYKEFTRNGIHVRAVKEEKRKRLFDLYKGGDFVSTLEAGKIADKLGCTKSYIYYLCNKELMLRGYRVKSCK